MAVARGMCPTLVDPSFLLKSHTDLPPQRKQLPQAGA